MTGHMQRLTAIGAGTHTRDANSSVCRFFFKAKPPFSFTVCHERALFAITSRRHSGRRARTNVNTHRALPLFVSQILAFAARCFFISCTVGVQRHQRPPYVPPRVNVSHLQSETQKPQLTGLDFIRYYAATSLISTQSLKVICTE